MATISTTGTNNDPVTTTKGATESTAEWLARHKLAIQDAGVAGSDALTSGWGVDCSAETDRANGQSDADFVEAHMADIGSEMVECPP